MDYVNGNLRPVSIQEVDAVPLAGIEISVYEFAEGPQVLCRFGTNSMESEGTVFGFSAQNATILANGILAAVAYIRSAAAARGAGSVEVAQEAKGAQPS